MTKPRNVRSRTAKSTAKQPTSRPKMAKSPDDLVAMFEASVKAFSDVEVRKVFGYPCGFVNGYMTVGLFSQDFFVRLPPEEQDALLSMPGGRRLEPMPGRPMREYVVLPMGVRQNKAQLEKWIERAILHSRSLPPKKKSRR